MSESDNTPAGGGETRASFRNMAGREDIDDVLAAELEAAGITVHRHRFLKNGKSEVNTEVMGDLHGWGFRRAWCYWVADGPGIEVEAAERLHATHGNEVRVSGLCGCPSPREQFNGLAVGSYHIDSPSGLKALADTIRALVERPAAPTSEGGTIPAGWKLVPEEPTPTMVAATWNDPIDTKGGIESQNARNKRVYAAMFAAAPKAPTPVTSAPGAEGGDDLAGLSARATPGPWYVESEPTDGSYGSGEDGGEGYDAFAIRTEAEQHYGLPGTLFHSHNSTVGCVETESNEDDFSAWDAVAKANAEFIVALVNAYRSGRITPAAPTPAPVAQGEPVGWVVWYDPLLHGVEERPRKIIDASMAFMDAAPIGTKLYAAPAAPRFADLPGREEIARALYEHDTHEPRFLWPIQNERMAANYRSRADAILTLLAATSRNAAETAEDAAYEHMEAVSALVQQGWDADECVYDEGRIRWLEEQARKSTTGISFDWVPSVDGEPSGFRFMRRFFIGQQCKTLRAAIDRAMKEHPQHKSDRSLTPPSPTQEMRAAEAPAVSRPAVGREEIAEVWWDRVCPKDWEGKWKFCKTLDDKLARQLVDETYEDADAILALMADPRDDTRAGGADAQEGGR